MYKQMITDQIKALMNLKSLQIMIISCQYLKYILP